jgi:hypothetical protein
MKKILFLFLAFSMYAIDYCSNSHRSTVIKDEVRQERTFFSCNNSWYYTEIRYNTSSNEPEIIAEKMKLEDQLIDPLLDIINYLSKDLSERRPTLVSLLDQETKDFLLNKDFMIIDKEFLLDNGFFAKDDIVIYILNKKDEMIELVSRKATPEERKIYIKIKAFEYATIKKALDAYHQNSKS